jgi:DNA-3-methyladenine glycosylase II
MVVPSRLDEAWLLRAVDVVGARDPKLGGIVARHGPPPLWARDPSFPTLVRIILEQQVSLTSAEAALGRLERAAGRIAPDAVIALGEPGMAGAGLTRQKSRYLLELASRVSDGRLDLARVAGLPDDDARAELMALPGIGRWTADIYLLMALGRPDIWPIGDIALASASQAALGLATRPTQEELALRAEGWRPWRAVAARILWHGYLSGERPPRSRVVTGATGQLIAD